MAAIDIINRKPNLDEKQSEELEGNLWMHRLSNIVKSICSSGNRIKV